MTFLVPPQVLQFLVLLLAGKCKNRQNLERLMNCENLTFDCLL